MDRKRNERRGFTLVELLVVITIIGMLMGLLLPAVQAAREAGRRNTCSSNQHNLGLALMSYQSAKQSLPGFHMQPPLGRLAWRAPKRVRVVHRHKLVDLHVAVPRTYGHLELMELEYDRRLVLPHGGLP